MGLIWNRDYAVRTAYRSGVLHAGGLTTMQRRSRLTDNAIAFGRYTSQPQGYQSAARALVPTLKTSSFIATVLRGEGTMAGSLVAIGNMGATLEGSGTLAADANMAWNASATLDGESTLVPSLTSVGWMSANLDAGARPSAVDIAQATMAFMIENGVSFAEVMRILVAGMAGKTTVTPGVGATATVKFRNLGDTKDVIEASMDGSERTTVALDP
jgi:hypothetical protein